MSFRSRAVTLFVFLFAIAVLGAAVRPTLARQTPQELKSKGDALWNEQSYELASQAYRQALAKDAHLPDAAQIEFRIAVALVRAKKWDEATAAVDAFVEKFKDTTWEAQGQVWRGRLYALLPHVGYRVGQTFTRGNDVPRSNRGESPRRMELESEDAAKMRHSFTRAQLLFERFRKARLPESERADLTREEIELDFDLARAYAFDNDVSRFKPGIDWKIDVNASFDPEWPGPKKTMTLYAQIRALDETRPHTTHHDTVLAALSEAAFIMQLRQGGVWNLYEYRASVGNALNVVFPSRRRRPSFFPAQEVPYKAIDPIALLKTVLAQYPEDPDADRVQFTIATWTEQKGDAQAAVSVYGAFLSKYPASRWADDARRHLDGLLLPSLNVSAANSSLPGQRAILSLTTRNVSQVRFTAYRVTPEEVYGQGRYALQQGGQTWEAHPQFSDFVHHWNETQGVKGSRREKVAEWTAATNNDGKHGVVYNDVATPLDAPGAYLIEARAGEHDEIRHNALLLVSDLTVVQKVDKDSVLVYTADARTGKPVPHANLLLWEPIYYGYHPDREARYVTAQTDSAGLYRGKLPAPLDASTYSYAQRRAAVFAQAGPNRYAVTQEGQFTDYEASTGERAFRAYVTTDRSLYRPKQEVKYHVVLVSGVAGSYQPAVNAKVRLFVNSGRGELLRKDIMTGAFGSYSDTFALPPGADLGDYTLSVHAPAFSNPQYGSVGFRVEEYKKPEFTVSVAPEKSVVRVGEILNVTVSARFFFGAPVTNARVHYRVSRSPYAPPSPVRPRLDWYDDTPTSGFSLAGYNGYNGYNSYLNFGGYNPYGRSGGYNGYRGSGGAWPWWDAQNNGVNGGANNGLYREGDLVTDAKGEAHIAFPTDLPRPLRGLNTALYPDTDQNFTITADVVDSSRRQVSGAGRARATRAQFHAYLNLDRQFVLPGDALTIDVRTRDGGDKPFAAGGYVHFTRLIPAVPQIKQIDPNTGKTVITQAYAPPREEDGGKLFVQTDATNDGLGKIVWHPETPGDYRLDYAAPDAWGNDVAANATVLVYGPQWDNSRPDKDGRFQMVAEHGDYRIGDTAHVLLLTPAADSWVLFTEQAIGSIIRFRAVYVPGRSTIINAPITDAHVPNAAFTATLVRDGQVQETGCEVGVPAENHIFALTVTPDKKQYKPGEKATFTLHATNAQGRPAQGEISLAVVDQSLIAMQADLAPDIRRFFYGYRLQTQVGGAVSTYFGVGSETFAPSSPAYETHPLVYPEGVGWLLDHLGGGTKTELPTFIAYNPPPAFPPGRGRGRSGTRDAANAPGSYDFYDYSGALTAGRPGGMYGPAGMPGSGGPMGMGAATARAGDSLGRAAGFLQGISPQDIFALDTDNSLILRYNDPQEALRGNGSTLVAATVRRLFADTAFWTPAVVTDRQGQACVTFDFPDNITQWRVTARGVTKDIQVGLAEAHTLTKKNLLVRLQAPRFFVDRDQVTISANVHNYLDAAKNARIQLVTEAGLQVVRSSGVQENASPTVTPAAYTPQSTNAGPKPRTPEPPNTDASNAITRNLVIDKVIEKDGEARIDWTVNVRKAGLTKIKVIAQTNEESDAAEMEFPVLAHGVEKFIARNGVLRDGGKATETFDLPDLRRKGVTLLDVQMSSSLAGVMLDALPYLENYPYGCVEQTLSRFVPTVLVAKTLRDTGIDLETLGRRARALEEQRRTIPPQQVFADSGYTYPKGIPGVLDMKEMSERHAFRMRDLASAPLFDSAALKAMTDEGLQKLYQWQRGDGSWGWWSGSALGDPYLTAYVVEHLILAQQAGVPVSQEVLSRGYAYVATHFNSVEDLHLMAYYDYVLCLYATVVKIEATAEWQQTHRFLYDRRDRLNAYGQALLSLAHHYVHDDERAGVLVRNLVTTVKRDNERGTAHWESSDREYWRWVNDKQETTALCLRALTAVGEKEQGLNTLAAMSVRWLVDNRRGGYWTSTKQTAIVIQALMEYARANNELTPDYTVTLDVDGRVQKTYRINKENSLLFDNRFLVGDEILTSGGQQLHITMQGTGTLYYGAYMKFFDMSEPITAQSNAIAVERKYYRIENREGEKRSKAEEKKPGSPEHLNIPTPEHRIPLPDGAELASGDIIEVELFLKSDNDYNYVVFEDMKPAGCEALETRSGIAYGDGLCSNMELRDEKVAFFIDTLPQGTRRLTYRLRAEIPGQFHALPTNAYAMYAPDIRALSDEWRTTIHDAPPYSVPAKRAMSPSPSLPRAR